MADGSKAIRSTLALALPLVVWLVTLPSQLWGRPQGIRTTPQPFSWKRPLYLDVLRLPAHVAARISLFSKSMIADRRSHTRQLARLGPARIPGGKRVSQAESGLSGGKDCFRQPSVGLGDYRGAISSNPPYPHLPQNPCRVVDRGRKCDGRELGSRKSGVSLRDSADPARPGICASAQSRLFPIFS